MSFHSVYVSLPGTKFKFNEIYWKGESDCAPVRGVLAHSSYKGLWKCMPVIASPWSSPLGQLTVSGPNTAIHPEAQKWHRAAAGARWWRPPPTRSWSAAGRDPIPSVLRELQSYWHSLRITRRHQNRGHLFMNTCRKCKSTWFSDFIRNVRLSQSFQVPRLSVGVESMCAQPSPVCCPVCNLVSSPV